jgi:Putative bacterial sensory transduction regulator
MAAVDEVESYLASMPGLNARRLAHTEWGIAVPGDSVGGDPIEASLRIADGLLRVQALALHAAGDLDPWMLLWWNRQTRVVRFGCSRARDIWVHGEVAVAAVDEVGIDRLLGLVTEAVMAVRAHAAGARAPDEPPEGEPTAAGGWLPG